MKSIWLEDSWCQFLPSLHRQLAEPSLESGLPLDRHDLKDEHICAWWETLRYLFRNLIGWRDLPSGLAAWYLAGKPTHNDPRLQLAKERWDRANEIDWFAAREWMTLGFTGISQVQESALSRDFQPEDGWWRQFEARQPHTSPNPFEGGSNPLHLGHSDGVGLQESKEPLWTQYDATKRTAVIVVQSFETWRTDLQAFGNRLPKLKERSWHIEVFDRKIGCLGRFRQSRVTGIWFQGKHSLHMLGTTSAQNKNLNA